MVGSMELTTEELNDASGGIMNCQTEAWATTMQGICDGLRKAGAIDVCPTGGTGGVPQPC